MAFCATSLIVFDLYYVNEIVLFIYIYIYYISTVVAIDKQLFNAAAAAKSCVANKTRSDSILQFNSNSNVTYVNELGECECEA